jgi:hypothetical protein
LTKVQWNDWWHKRAFSLRIIHCSDMSVSQPQWFQRLRTNCRLLLWVQNQKLQQSQSSMRSRESFGSCKQFMNCCCAQGRENNSSLRRMSVSQHARSLPLVHLDKLNTHPLVVPLSFCFTSNLISETGTSASCSQSHSLDGGWDVGTWNSQFPSSKLSIGSLQCISLQRSLRTIIFR